MTQQTLYSLRTDGDQYRITKFTDGDVESSYLCTTHECECPAGVRPSCRHRQMLPQMLAHGLTNTHWFWDFDRGYACDFQGGSKQLADALTRAEEETKEDVPFDTVPSPDNELAFEDYKPASHKAWRRF